MAIAPGLVKAVIVYAKLSAANLETVREDFVATYQQVIQGNGQSLISSSTSGKSFTWNTHMTNEEKLVVLSQALQVLDGNAPKTVYPRYF